ncbi:MAG: bifunctional diaminohydroxyphosphoribosylaminopyrimidine deaminase/5-amino-6-(5-phosphoribosylamino)uracil reductase RibD [bacterium]
MNALAMQTLDREMMARAVKLAARGQYSVSPNPAVGCVIARGDKLIAEGWHRRAGEAHAEVDALDQAGEQAEGATAYVTLEPCSHTGRTPPCVDALIEAQVGRVLYGMKDPNPLVAGRGIARLREAGIQVEGPLLEAECIGLNPGYVKRHKTGLPRVTVKLAMSLDGRTAMANGESQWITGEAARRDVQRLRARSCAVISGINTVLRDNARLSVRGDELALSDASWIRQPLRVVLDTQARLPEDAPLLKTGGAILQVVGDGGANAPMPDSLLLERLHISGCDRVDVHRLLNVLAERHCNEVLVEAGATLAGSFMQAGLVDELVVYMAPSLMGSTARPLLELPLSSMNEQIRLEIADIRSVGTDIRITARPVAQKV